MEWSHHSNLTLSSHSVPQNFAMSGTLLRRVISDAPGTAGPLA